MRGPAIRPGETLASFSAGQGWTTSSMSMFACSTLLAHPPLLYSENREEGLPPPPVLLPLLIKWLEEKILEGTGSWPGFSPLSLPKKQPRCFCGTVKEERGDVASMQVESLRRSHESPLPTCDGGVSFSHWTNSLEQQSLETTAAGKKSSPSWAALCVPLVKPQNTLSTAPPRVLHIQLPLHGMPGTWPAEVADTGSGWQQRPMGAVVGGLS